MYTYHYGQYGGEKLEYYSIILLSYIHRVLTFIFTIKFVLY